jgi:DNA-binding IclR family transcriptional regulator
MGHGLGTTQKAILAALADTEYDALTIGELAARLDRSPRQVRTAVAALEGRKLVVVTKEHLYWRGKGEYGHLVKRRDEDAPVTMAVKAGERWPLNHTGSYGIPSSGMDPWTWTALRDTEFTRNGVPTYGLLVWLPANREKFVIRERESARARIEAATEFSQGVRGG